MTQPWFEAAFGTHYPTLYSHRDENEARQCLELLPDLAPLTQGGPLLDLGCGQGRHLRQLAEGGLDVVGLDLSRPLLDLASKLWPAGQGPLIQGDMRWLPFKENSYDAVLSLFTAFGYFGILEENSSVVQEVARVLAPGGHWFFDYVDCDSVRNELAGADGELRVRTEGPLLVEDSRCLTQGGQLVEKTVVIRPAPGSEAEAKALGITPEGMTYTESVALFSLEQMENLARQFGLNLVASAGSYCGAPLGEGKRWILVFQKQEKD